MLAPDHHTVFQTLFFWGKVSAALGGIGGVGYGVGKFILSMIRSAAKINDNVQLLMTNHLPHIQAALDKNTDQMTGIVADVRTMDAKMEGVIQRVNDTNDRIGSLNESFCRHLENQNKES